MDRAILTQDCQRDAFSIALEKLEQNVLELKGKRSETEEREAVLRKLHDR
ncbi:hypothetical protein [Haloarcula amylovorans]|nr:hypothetical protein [Halomicroarcula amylolytica]